MIRHFLVLAPLLLPLTAPAADTTGFSASIERIDAADWHVRQLTTALEFADDGIRGDIRIGLLTLPGAELSFADSRIACQRILLSRSYLRCHDAMLTAEFPGLGRLTVPASFDYARDTGTTLFELKGLPLAGGELTLRGSTGAAGTDVTFSGTRLQVSGLIAVANQLKLLAGTFDASGTVGIDGTLTSNADGKFQSTITTTMQTVSLSNELGTLVTDALNGRLSVDARSDGRQWQFTVEFAGDRGEVYVEPIYANLAQHALRLRAGGVRTDDFRSFAIDEFLVDQDSQVTLSGSATVALPGDDGGTVSLSGTVDITETSLEAIYSSVLRIAAAGTVLGDLETAGRIAGRIKVQDNAPLSATLELRDVIVDDLKRRFALYGVNGTLHWPGPTAAAADAPPSQLHWESGNAYNIELGAATIEARLGGADFELLKPLRLPTMGGALLINQLVVNDYGTEEASGLLDAELEPVQLGQLSGALGWPAFSGSLSGRLPLLQYQGNSMTVGGSLTASAFGGDIEVSGLRIAQPFGLVPRLDATISLRQLDLERLTNTFSFGLIQGRLSGDVTGLSMIGWQPVAMDMHLYTPEKDRTPHRISQRAVENLASVGGGGAAAALSGGLLKFFEVFAYDRIALRCVLRDGSCAMSGAGAAGDGPLGKGFYIVKGKGVPRIDVVGYRSKVSWSALLRQLSNITRSEAPVVK